MPWFLSEDDLSSGARVRGKPSPLPEQAVPLGIAVRSHFAPKNLRELRKAVMQPLNEAALSRNTKRENRIDKGTVIPRWETAPGWAEAKEKLAAIDNAVVRLLCDGWAFGKYTFWGRRDDPQGKYEVLDYWELIRAGLIATRIQEGGGIDLRLDKIVIPDGPRYFGAHVSEVAANLTTPKSRTTKKRRLADRILDKLFNDGQIQLGQDWREVYKEVGKDPDFQAHSFGDRIFRDTYWPEFEARKAAENSHN